MKESHKKLAKTYSQRLNLVGQDGKKVELHNSTIEGLQLAIATLMTVEEEEAFFELVRTINSKEV